MVQRIRYLWVVNISTAYFPRCLMVSNVDQCLQRKVVRELSKELSKELSRELSREFTVSKNLIS